MMEKLMPMTDFVLQNAYTNEIVKDFHSVLIKHCKYAEFLKQPLTLGMFVPCDLDGNVMVEPEQYKNVNEFNDFIKEFREAKDRVLFEGFTIDGKNAFTATVGNGKINYDLKQVEAYDLTIENLVNDNLQLTPAAEKQIG